MALDLPPADGVTTDPSDDASLQAYLAHAALGLTDKPCIRPRQIAIANRWLTPPAAEIDWARTIVATVKDGPVAVLDSQMIDRPVVLRAEAIFAGHRAQDSKGKHPRG